MKSVAANGEVEAAAQEAQVTPVADAPVARSLDYGDQVAESTNGHRPRRRFEPAAAKDEADYSAADMGGSNGPLLRNVTDGSDGDSPMVLGRSPHVRSPSKA